MISGAMRGKGLGDALAKHLLKPENDEVHVVAPRGLGSPDLVGQVRELVALSLGGRTDQPVYHCHCVPDPSIADNDGARARWWSLFEGEFGLRLQPFCGAVHVKHGRRHEHRVYGVVRRDGSVCNLAWDYARREKVSRIVEFEFGLEPVPSKHARAIARELIRDGRDDVAAWLELAGMLAIERPVAPLSPQERLIQERSGIQLSTVRAAALAAWRASDDGESLRSALAEHGLRLHAGRAGPVVVDASGTVHLLTRIVGAASRAADGTRIPAPAVRARLAGISLTQTGANDGSGSLAAVGPHGASGSNSGNSAAGAGAGRLGTVRPDRGAERVAGRRGRADSRDQSTPLNRLRSLSNLQRGRLGRLVSGIDCDTEIKIEVIDKARAGLGNGQAITDMWGIGQLSAPAP